MASSLNLGQAFFFGYGMLGLALLGQEELKFSTEGMLAQPITNISSHKPTGRNAY
jgi:hypothetical protein